jgi:RNA polymerase sigma-70 factor (ECF subfamily)
VHIRIARGGNDMLHQPSDEDLMSRVKRGEAEAFEMLLARYQKPLFSFIFRMVGDFHKAQDIFQETFFRVFRNAWRYDESLRFSPWLYRIARNLCLEEIRRRKRVKIILVDEGAKLQPKELWGRETLDEEVEEMRRIVERAILQLPERQREVLLLRENQGLSYEDIAQITGMSVPAIKSCLHRARMALKDILAPYLRSSGMQSERRGRNEM